MSVTLLSRALWTDFRDVRYTDKDGGEITISPSAAKSVMVAITDSADDFGENSFNSFDTLAQKSSLKRRSVIRIIRGLVATGWISIAGISTYGTNSIKINIEKLGNPPKKRSKVGRPKIGDSETEIGDSRAKIGDSQSPDPFLSIRSPLPPVRTKPSPLPLSEMPVEWQIMAGAEQITLRPNQEEQNQLDYALMNLCHNNMHLEPLARAFMQTRKIYPNKGEVKGWRVKFQEMYDKGVRAQHVEAAVKQLTEKNMVVSSPFSIYNTAVDLANRPQQMTFEGRMKYNSKGELVADE